MRQHICSCGAIISAADQAALELAIIAHNVTVHNAPAPVPTTFQKVKAAVVRIVPLVKGSTINSLAVKFSQPEAIAMPAIINMQQQVQAFVDAFDTNGNSTVLASGQSVTVAIADPTIASFVQDTNPAIDPNGIQSIESVVVSPIAPGSTSITATVNNSDGSVAATISDTVTVTVTQGGAIASLKITFGAPTSKVTASATRRA